jgi:hypothetical protein
VKLSRYRARRLGAAGIALLLAASLAACATPSANDSVRSVPGVALSSEMATDGSALTDLSVAPASAGSSIISNGGIALSVENARASAEAVTAVAKGLGGYVETQMVTSDGAAHENAQLTIRVPSNQFDAAFDELTELGEVVDEHRSTQDVTTQHVDLQARVEALQASVDRLTDLMSQAATTGELIEAESALSARQAELDGLRAQLNSLEGQVDEATIWVSLTVRSALPGGPSTFWDGLKAGFESLGTAAAGALVLLGILVPWLVIAAVITAVIIWIVRVSRRRRQRAAAQATTAQATATHATVSPSAATHAPSPAPEDPGV